MFHSNSKADRKTFAAIHVGTSTEVSGAPEGPPIFIVVSFSPARAIRNLGAVSSPSSGAIRNPVMAFVCAGVAKSERAGSLVIKCRLAASS